MQILLSGKSALWDILTVRSANIAVCDILTVEYESADLHDPTIFHVSSTKIEVFDTLIVKSANIDLSSNFTA